MVICWSVGQSVGWLVSRSTIRVLGLWEVSLEKDNGPMGTFQLLILCTCMVGRHMSHMNEGFVHLGGGGAW